MTNKLTDKEKQLKDFGLRLKNIRIEKDLTQEELAQKIGTSKSVISGYETGRNDPGQTVILNLSKSLGVSVNYLMGIEESSQDTSDLDEDLLVLARNAKTLTQDQLQAIKRTIDAFKKSNED